MDTQYDLDTQYEIDTRSEPDTHIDPSMDLLINKNMNSSECINHIQNSYSKHSYNDECEFIECFICFFNITNKNSYYYCHGCQKSAHQKCYNNWWNNSKNNKNKCAHCQTFNNLSLFKPHSSNENNKYLSYKKYSIFKFFNSIRKFFYKCYISV